MITSQNSRGSSIHRSLVDLGSQVGPLGPLRWGPLRWGPCQVTALLLVDELSQEFWRLVDEVLLPIAAVLCLPRAVLGEASCCPGASGAEDQHRRGEFSWGLVAVFVMMILKFMVGLWFIHGESWEIHVCNTYLQVNHKLSMVELGFALLSWISC